jgi:hypothetical protein
MHLRLRSALKGGKDRISRSPSFRTPEDKDNLQTARRAKTVQFPADSSNLSISSSRDRKGKRTAEEISADDDPVHPGEVLARTGESVEGTSAGVVEAAAKAGSEVSDDVEGDEEDATPGEVVMRGGSLFVL